MFTQAGPLLSLRVDSLIAPVSLSARLGSDVPDPVATNNASSTPLTLGGDGDIPVLPAWALLLLGTGLMMQLRPARRLRA